MLPMEKTECAQCPSTEGIPYKGNVCRKAGDCGLEDPKQSKTVSVECKILGGRRAWQREVRKSETMRDQGKKLRLHIWAIGGQSQIQSQVKWYELCVMKTILFFVGSTGD
jgi:hypothetical protein